MEAARSSKKKQPLYSQKPKNAGKNISQKENTHAHLATYTLQQTQEGDFFEHAFQINLKKIQLQTTFHVNYKVQS